jgi:hypothetical protein
MTSRERRTVNSKRAAQGLPALSKLEIRALEIRAAAERMSAMPTLPIRMRSMSAGARTGLRRFLGSFA